MLKAFCVGAVLFTVCFAARAEVLIVADEFPAMEVVAQQLQKEEGVSSQLVDQEHLPASLAPFQAVVVYIHLSLKAAAEHAFIEYAERGGRLVLLHHSISSGKRQNRDWFTFLGIDLPQGDVQRGGYKWTEGVNVTYVSLASADPITTRQMRYPESVSCDTGEGARARPGFTLNDTEVYLNHVLKGPHAILLGLKYTDPKSGQTWMQATAGWRRPAGTGWVLYLMPGHSGRDFENSTYGRLVLNAITAPLAVTSP
jgi:hypothetical protein